MNPNRFEVVPVSEPIRSRSLTQPPELIPLINVEHEISSLARPQSPPYLATTTSQMPGRFFNSYLRRKPFSALRRASVAAAVASKAQSSSKPTSSSLDTLSEIPSTLTTSLPPYPTSLTDATLANTEGDETDVYSTMQSNVYETTSARPTNKFLQELRSKRRELQEKSKNVSIDQRIAFNRRQHPRRIVRAQDIFAVHFELNDEDDFPLPLTDENLFTEESQEKIRNDIFAELNRQQIKQYYKQHRHLLFARALLLLMTALFAFMSFTLVYVVSDLYDRGRHLDTKLPENEYISMIYDQVKTFQ